MIRNKILYGNILETPRIEVTGGSVEDWEFEEINFIGFTAITKAFCYGLSKLKKIIIGEGVAEIPANFAYNCVLLEDLVLPDIISIGNYAFRNCNNLNLTSLPSTLEDIGIRAFTDCSSLTLKPIEGDLLTGIIPSGITQIKEGAFDGCINLELSSLSDNITSIETYAFRYCEKIAWTSLPSGLTSIPVNGFSGCKALNISQLPRGVKNIGGSAFANCTSLISIEIFEDIETISATAFLGCDNITDIIIHKTEGDISYSPWGAVNATVTWDTTS